MIGLIWALFFQMTFSSLLTPSFHPFSFLLLRLRKQQQQRHGRNSPSCLCPLWHVTSFCFLSRNLLDDFNSQEAKSKIISKNLCRNREKENVHACGRVCKREEGWVREWRRRENGGGGRETSWRSGEKMKRKNRKNRKKKRKKWQERKTKGEGAYFLTLFPLAPSCSTMHFLPSREGTNWHYDCQVSGSRSCQSGVCLCVWYFMKFGSTMTFAEDDWLQLQERSTFLVSWATEPALRLFC